MTYFPSPPPPDAMLMSGIQVIFGRLNIAWGIQVIFGRLNIAWGIQVIFGRLNIAWGIQVIFGRLNIAWGKGGQNKWFTKTTLPTSF